MIPRELELFNVCQYRYRQLVYKRGALGITGRNGAGKSNLVTTAQLFAITGKPYGCTKSELLNWYSQSGETRFTFDYDGCTYRLSRRVDKASVELVSDKETVTGQGPVAELLMDMLGTSLDVIQETCWVPQGTLPDAVRMSASVRLGFFQNLARLSVAEDLRDKLQKHVQQIQIPEDCTAALAEARDKLADTLIDLQTQEDSLTNLRADEALLLEEAAVYANLEGISETAYIEQVNKCRTDLRSADMALARLREAYKDIPETMSISMSKQETAALLAFERLKTLEPAYAKAVAKLGELTAKLVGTSLEDARETAAACSGRVQHARQHLEAARKGACPTCGTQLGQSQEEVQRLQAEYTALLEVEKADKQALHDWEDYTTMFRETGKLGESLTEVQKQTSGFVHDELAAKTKAISRQNTMATQYAAAQAELRAADLRLNTAKAKLQAAEEAVYIPDATAKLKHEADAAVRAIRAAIQTSERSKRGLEVAVEHEQRNVDRLQAQLARYDKARLTAARLGKAREFLHRSSAPRVILRQVLMRLNQQLALYLGGFDTNFTAYLDSDFDFKAVFGGKTVSAGRLSGGQMVALAVAFRLALSDLFSSRLPLLVLDEPTVFLDEQNTVHLSACLRRARMFTHKNMFIQIATHDQNILASCTEVQDVEKEKTDE